MSEINDSYGYVLYVDEAGDDGTRIFKPEDPKGSSEWLCLAGYLVRREVDTELPNLLSSIRADIGANQGPALHYRDLSPTKRQRACDLLGSAPARAFVVCSFKRTMQGHSNARAAARSGGTKQYLYNWIVRILLERVTDLCWRDSERRPADQRRVKLVFSHRGGHRYGQMKAYLELLRRQAIGKSTYIHPPDQARRDQLASDRVGSALSTRWSAACGYSRQCCLSGMRHNLSELVVPTSSRLEANNGSGG